jgi:hypothetical protein
MKLMAILLGLFFCLSYGADSYAQSLGPQRALRKLSRKLRMGVEPATADQDQLAAIAQEKGPNSPEVTAFLSQKAKEYVQTKEFNDKMRYHLQTLFRFTTFTTDANGLPIITKGSDGYDDSTLMVGQMSEALNASTYSVFTDVVENNKSWDTLLTGKSYRISNNIYFSDPKKIAYLQESSFFQNVRGDSTAEGISTVFNDNDSRIAGVLTSTQFRARYHAGPSNASRRLSQAVFRIFLCDNLQPAFIPVASEDAENVLILKGLLDKLKQPGNAITEQQIINTMSENEIQHGTEATCMACHSKLDPLAQSFGLFGNIALTNTPSPGAIYFKRSASTTVNIQAAGIGELGKAITTLPEYTQCQTENFWKWFIGGEVPLADGRRAELADLFTGKKMYEGKKIDRKPKDFVQMLVSQPEFRLDVEKLDPNSPEMVQSLLRSCNQCHTSSNRVTFGARPFGGSLAEDTRLVDELKIRILELEEGDEGAMPSNRSSWSESDLKKVKNWVQQLNYMEGAQ